MYKHLRATGLVLMSLIAVETGFFGAAQAGEFAFESVRLRGGLSGGSPLGKERQSDFNQIDLAATIRLPWEKELGGGWMLGTAAIFLSCTGWRLIPESSALPLRLVGILLLECAAISTMIPPRRLGNRHRHRSTSYCNLCHRRGCQGASHSNFIFRLWL